jgi:hypothetical protein
MHTHSPLHLVHFHRSYAIFRGHARSLSCVWCPRAHGRAHSHQISNCSVVVPNHENGSFTFTNADTLRRAYDTTASCRCQARDSVRVQVVPGEKCGMSIQRLGYLQLFLAFSPSLFRASFFMIAILMQCENKKTNRRHSRPPTLDAGHTRP